MRGILVINQFLHSAKFDELVTLFEKAAEKIDVSLSVVRNAQFDANFKEADFVLFWDKDILLAKQLEHQGLLVFNSADAIDCCDHKGKTWLALKEAGLPTPKTIVAPMTYENIGYTDTSFLETVVESLGLPLIVKEAYGSFGEQVYRMEDMKTLTEITCKLQGKPFLYQEYIEESKGKDVRLQVVGDKVVAAMYRYSDNDFRANITAGGHMKDYLPSDEEKELAIKAAKAVKADFAGVDLLFSKKGPLVCEVNSNAHFKNILDCTGVNTAEKMMKYIKNKVEKAKL